jgi:transposase
MPRYKYFDTSQGLFLTVSLDQQLIHGSFEHTLNYLIDQFDLSAFDAAFHNDRLGAPAYPPDVMLKIIFYCYSRGIITSRPIAYDCKTNIVVKALARDMEPDHDTIAHFISSQGEAVKKLFAQVLLKCYALGLIGGELFGIDGCKLPSNAAQEWSGTLEELGKKKKDLEALMEKLLTQHVLLLRPLKPVSAFYKTNEERLRHRITRVCVSFGFALGPRLRIRERLTILKGILHCGGPYG